MVRIRYFHNAGVGRSIALIAVVGIELLLASRVWAMIESGFAFLNSAVYQAALAWIVAPIVLGLAVWLYLHGEYALSDIHDYEREYGHHVRHVVYLDGKEGMQHYDRPSRTWAVYALYILVISVETWAILYGVFDARLPAQDQVWQFGVFESLAFVPFLVGRILHASVNRPISSMRKQHEREMALLKFEEEYTAAKSRSKASTPVKVNELPPERDALPDHGGSRPNFRMALPQHAARWGHPLARGPLPVSKDGKKEESDHK